MDKKEQLDTLVSINNKLIDLLYFAELSSNHETLLIHCKQHINKVITDLQAKL